MRMLILLFVSSLAFGAEQSKDVPELLLSGTQEQVDKLTNSLLDGSICFKAEWVTDMRLFPDENSSVEFRIKEEDGGIWHGGVENLGDYFMCLLEWGTKISAEDIIKKNNGELLQDCTDPSYRCGSCFSSTYPPTKAVRVALQGYWKKYLSERKPFCLKKEQIIENN